MQITMERLTGALVLITAIGVYAGLSALDEYKRANMIAAYARISQLDRDVYTMGMNNDKFDSLFAFTPIATTPDEVKNNSMKLLSLSVDSRIRDQIPRINSIEELFNILYSCEEYDNSAYKTELRNAFMHADLMFYTVAEAHSVFKAGLMTKEDYKTWAAYVTDVGAHPLFLLSVYNAYEGGYIDADFAYELREILIKNQKTSIVIETLYPEMFKDKKWAYSVGKDGIGNHKPTKYAK